MPTFSVTYDDSCHIVVSTLRGAIDEPTIDANRRETLRLVIQHGCRAVLIDLREAKSAVSMFTVFQQPEESAKLLSESNLDYADFKRAIVIDDVNEDARFFEIVGLNRWHNIKLFHSTEEARQWLCESPSPPDKRLNRGDESRGS